jgi:ribosomal-protein-alanine N-acetyltransferase
MNVLAVNPGDDLVPFSEIHKACFAQAWTADALRDLLKTAGTLAFSVPGGFVMTRVAGNEAEILTIAVAPGSRRKGVASALLNEAARQANRHGAHTMFLEVAEMNAAAFGLYNGLGFREVGRRKSYYGPGEDALILRAELPLVPLGNPKASTRV